MSDLTINPIHVRPLVGSTVSRGVAGEAMTVGELAYMFDGDTRTVKRTDADDVATVSGRIFQIVAGGRHDPAGAVGLGEAVTLLEFGRVSWGPDVNLDVTKQYYVSNTVGKAADAAGTKTRRIGSPETSEVFFFNPDTAVAYT